MRKLTVFANVLAVAALGGALAYYNFVDKAPVSGVKKGDRCPDFTAQTLTVQEGVFAGGESFTLSEHIGQVCVVNFWETWCQACIEELSEFNRLQVEYREQIEVVAVVGADPTRTVENACKWLNERGWSTYDPAHDWATFSLTFSYLSADICTDLGCSGMLPRTVIVDKSGIVAHEVDAPMSYGELKAILDELL